MPLDPAHLFYERFNTAALLYQRQEEIFAATNGSFEIPITEYNQIYNFLIERLRRVGSVGEDGDDGDFSTSRFVPPSSEITVVVNGDFGIKLVPLAVGVLNAIKRPFIITYDMVDYVSVISTGNVLGYGEMHELSYYGFPD